MRILVCGDRNWTNKDLIKKVLLDLKVEIDEIIEGEARGADSLAREVAEELKIPVRKFPAKWEKFGKGAGFIRNNQMLDQKPDLVIAFHNDIEHSKGTKQCAIEARRRGIKVMLVSEHSVILQ